MSLRVTRSQSGKTPVKPARPGFVETPGRRKSQRKSLASDADSSYEITPEPEVGVKTEEIEDEHVNGHTNGNGNGHANGLTNGHTNGNGNGHANGHTNGHADSKAEAKAFDWKYEAEKNFPAKDEGGKSEFGGALGMSAMMICFPALMYYMWIGSIFYDGKFPTPAEGQDWQQFFAHMWHLVKTEAYPTNYAWQIYWFFGLAQMAFYMLMPGVYRKGKGLPHLGGKQLDYYCSAMWSFYSSIVISLVLHFTGIFKLYTLIDEFGHIMSVAIISGFLCSFIAYFSAQIRGTTVRMTGSPVVDFFLGAELNPRLFGILDFKMFLEVRIPWFILFFLSLGTCLKQYEMYGKPSMEAVFLLFAHYLYAGACSKGEHLIITSWDMYYEKLGFMLIFWNMAGVPLSYCHCILFVATHDPSEYTWPTWFTALLTIAYLGVYYVWDTTNSQKNQFRQEERGVVEERTTFPYFKYGRIDSPNIIETKNGMKIFADGWYGKARKIHYTCDAFFAVCWGLITGFSSPFPWFYSVFFLGMIIHRAIRDIEKCRAKYGEAWTEYEKQVPYLFIPYVF
ncbi:ergosterol biosynthesis ERG4/ERG24 family-domain-containing protein [Phaeosphaeriaceae sp. PMI808]|nr:ergosterol biosynthesis ERG4/ERG24 family-domain-containing protein [Phaeosphaeriaceae sp. PMI808]